LRLVEKLATAQRANKTPKRFRNIHVKIATGQDQHGQERSRRRWAGFKHMLSYKANTHGGMCLEVNEA
jgi:hypothetical protein